MNKLVRRLIACTFEEVPAMPNEDVLGASKRVHRGILEEGIEEMYTARDGGILVLARSMEGFMEGSEMPEGVVGAAVDDKGPERGRVNGISQEPADK